MGLNDGSGGMDATARLRGLMTRGGGGGMMDPNGGQGMGQAPGGGSNGLPPSLGALDRMGQGQGPGADQGRMSPMTNDQGATGDPSGGGNVPAPVMNVRAPGAGAGPMRPGQTDGIQDAGVTNMGADPGKMPGATEQAPTANGPQMAHDHLRRRMMMKQAMQQGMPASLAGLHSLGFGSFGQGGY